MEMQQISNQIADLKKIKVAIWIYFWLLIFEGALRKWVLPGLSDALLIVRDPIAIYILFLGIKNRLLKQNSYFKIAVAASLLSFFTTMIWGHQNLVVALYGVRIMLLHFPLIFIIAATFTVKDVLLVGKYLLWMALPMAIIVAIQFYSPQSAWINRGIGGNLEGAGFAGANGYMRPPGLFSFTSGNVICWGLIIAYVLFFLIENKIVARFITYIATLSIMAAFMFSISRTLLLELTLSVLSLISITVRKPKYILGVICIGAICIIIGFSLTNISVFHTGIETFITRFTFANEAEGGLNGVFIDRFLGGLIGAIKDDPNLSFWGKGIGMGTNAGAKLMTGSTTFLISEGEWGRLVGESGLLLGLIFILLRVVLAGQMLYKSIRAIRNGNSLPWMLMSFGFLITLQGQWAQPTNLGFAVLTGGLVLAAMNYPNKKLTQQIEKHENHLS